MTLGSLLRDTTELKNALVDAKREGLLSALEAQQALSHTAQLIKLLKDLMSGGGSTSGWVAGPLSDYMDWPNDRMPCPKCGDVKPSGRHYLPASKDGPERLQHRCFCGYFVYTRPLDETEREQHAVADVRSTEAP